MIFQFTSIKLIASEGLTSIARFIFIFFLEFRNSGIMFKLIDIKLISLCLLYFCFGNPGKIIIIMLQII